MRVVMFYHSLVSDWNHGNAHFLRGVVGELLHRGHDVRVLEPRDGWSRSNLMVQYGRSVINGFYRAYPGLHSDLYALDTLDIDDVLRGADLVIVHEWNEPALIAKVGSHHRQHASYLLLFHDTHHRSATDPAAVDRFDLRAYDGVLAFGDCVRDWYLDRGRIPRAWTWHEAADDRVFYPRRPTGSPQGDVVWIGNWGDEERSAELTEFLIHPIKELGLKATFYGVRYPASAIDQLKRDGIRYGGWLPNYDVPAVFAQHRITVHVPRRPYLEALPGVPTIRPFEALACGIPLISARWSDTTGLFSPDQDFLVANDGAEMIEHLRTLITNPTRRSELVTHGLTTIRQRHTCAHRVDELFGICTDLRGQLLGCA